MSDSKNSLTEKDMRNLALTWQCFIGGEPSIDYAKFAKLAGYTEGSAKTTLGILRRKIKSLGADHDTGAEASGPSTPVSGKKRGRKADEDGAGNAPKKPRGGRKSKAEMMAELDDEDDDEEEQKLGVDGTSDKKKTPARARKAKVENEVKDEADEADEADVVELDTVVVKDEEVDSEEGVVNAEEVV